MLNSFATELESHISFFKVSIGNSNDTVNMKMIDTKEPCLCLIAIKDQKSYSQLFSYSFLY